MKLAWTLRRALAATALMIAVVGAPVEGGATVMVKLSPEAHVAQSDVIARVVAGPSAARWNEDNSRPLTLTRLLVREYLKGAGPTELTLRQFGGTLDGMTMVVPGDGRLVEGREYLLFLRRGDGVVYLTAMGQSVYEVRPTSNGVMVQRDLSDVEFAAPDARGGIVVVEAPDEAPESLSRFTGAVLSIVRRGRR